MMGSGNSIAIGAQAGSAARGTTIFYRPGHTNTCPGCGQSQWHVGRLNAECAYCAMALPLSTSGRWYRPGGIGEAKAA